jgi:hypothetical protein
LYGGLYIKVGIFYPFHLLAEFYTSNSNDGLKDYEQNIETAVNEMVVTDAQSKKRYMLSSAHGLYFFKNRDIYLDARLLLARTMETLQKQYKRDEFTALR